MGDQSQQRIVVAVTSGFDIYHNAIFEGAGAVLAEHGISLVVHLDHESPIMPATLACLLRRPEVRGAILLAARGKEHEAVLHAPLVTSTIPVVRIGQNVSGQACVRADNAQGMAELMRLVLDDCGARKPGFVRWPGHQPDHLQREAVFRAELARRGLEVDEDRFVEGGSEVKSIQQAALQLLQNHPDTDAVITMHDWCALFVIEACLGAGKRIPEDIVVTGFDNYPMLGVTWPGVTTVDQHLREQGATAAQMIVEGLAGTHHREHVLTRCEVVPRGSTAVAGARHAAAVRQVEQVARLASTHLRTQVEIERVGHALMRCRSYDDVRAALPEHLAALGISRAFLAAYEGSAESEAAHGVKHHVARLMLDVRAGRSHPVPEVTYSSCDLLPEYLREELRQGSLAVIQLEGARSILGHLIIDLPVGQVPILPEITSTVNRTLEVIAGIRALSEHSATLERLVAQRSQELMAEIDIRQHAEQELRRANIELRRMETTDGLTRVANRRAFERYFAECWREHVEECAPLTVLMIDIDHFKAYNDHYGHLLGDETLRTVASWLSRSARYPNDLACRFGGEEFTVVLPYSGQRQGMTVARRFQQALAEAAVPHDASPVAPNVTVSIGLASFVPTTRDMPAHLVALADEALYRAKSEGRNRIATMARSTSSVPPAEEATPTWRTNSVV